MVANTVINSEISFPILAVTSGYVSWFSGKPEPTSALLLHVCSFTFSQLLQVSPPRCFPADISSQKCEINLRRAVRTQHRLAAQIRRGRSLPLPSAVLLV